MEEKQTQIENVTIVIYASPHTTLMDRRIYTHGMIFGTIEGVAKQYGVKIEEDGRLFKYTAPKSRMKLFIETLHFSAIPYSEVPA